MFSPFFLLDEIQTTLSAYTNVSLVKLAISEKADNLFWNMPQKCLSNTICVWIGDDDQSLFNTCLTVNGKYFKIYQIQFNLNKKM